MSGTSTSGTNGTIIVTGPNILQISDFYVRAGILHPLAIGSIAIIALFTCLRIGSNRSIVPITVFDWVINVALGSTLAGIVNGNSLVRGLLALATLPAFQYITSTVASRFHMRLAWIFQGPPLVIAFRGQMLRGVMRKHRISPMDINASLRQVGVLNICQVECAIIEPNGSISIFTTKQLKDARVEPEVLMAVPAYKALCEQDAGKRDERCEAEDEETVIEGRKGRSSGADRDACAMENS